MAEITVVDFGLNLDKGDAGWADKVEAFRKLVEKNGVALARWGCDGRSRHSMNAMHLAAELPQFDFETDYNAYLCKAKIRR